MYLIHRTIQTQLFLKINVNILDKVISQKLRDIGNIEKCNKYQILSI